MTIIPCSLAAAVFVVPMNIRRLLMAYNMVQN